MAKKDDLIKKISERGDQYGGKGGLLDLLSWCGKIGLWEVTEEEALRFLENPQITYQPHTQKK